MNRRQRRASRGSANQRRKSAKEERRQLHAREYAAREELCRRVADGERATVGGISGWGFEGRAAIEDLREFLKRPGVVVFKPPSMGPTRGVLENMLALGAYMGARQSEAERCAGKKLRSLWEMVPAAEEIER